MTWLDDVDAHRKDYDISARGAIRVMIIWLCVISVLFAFANAVLFTIVVWKP